MNKLIKKTTRTKTTLWNLFHLYLNVIIGIIRGFLIIPLYLSYISNDLYGAWLATGNILMWLTLFDPGVGDVAIQKVSEAYGKNDKTTIKYVVSSSLFISFIICILAFIVGISINDLLIRFVRIPDTIDHLHLRRAFNVTVVSTAITLFSFSLSGTIIGFQETKLLGWIRNGSSLLALFLNVILLLKGYKLLSIAYSGLIAALFQTILYVILLFFLMRKEKIEIAFNFSFLKNYSKIFSFTFVSKLFSTIAQNLDLILVSRFVSVDNVTILELSRRPLKVIRTLATSPSIAMLPSIAHLYGENDLNRLREVILKASRILSYILILIAAGFIAFNSPLIKLWVGSQYYIGDFLNLVLVLTFLFSTFAYVISNFTYSVGKIRENSIFEVIKNFFAILFLIAFGYLWQLRGIVFVGLLITILTELWYYPQLLNRSIKYSVIQVSSFFKEMLLAIIGSGIITFCFFMIKIDGWINLTLASAIFVVLNLTFFLIISKEIRQFSRQFLGALLKIKFKMK